MNGRRRKLLLGGGFLFVLLALAGFLVAKQPAGGKPSRTLADGRVITLEKVSYGLTHQWAGGLKERVANWLPYRVGRLIGIRGGGGSISFGKPGMVLWVSCYDPAQRKYVAGSWGGVEAVDEHGCVFRSGGWGTTGSGDFVAICLNVANHPRRQKEFKVRLLDQNEKAVAEFAVENPGWKATPEWTPDRLPCTKTNGDLTATLIRVSAPAKPEIEIRQNGKPAGDWMVKEVEWEDAGGNESAKLCRYEPAWKARAALFRKPESEFGAEEVWTLKNLKVLGSGETTPLGLSGQAGGMTLQVIAAGGPGRYETSNGVFVSNTPWKEGMTEGMSTSSGPSANGQEYVTVQRFGSASFFVLLKASGWAAHRRLFLRVRDDQGRVTTSDQFNGGNDSYVYRFQVAPDAKVIDVDFIVQTGRQFDFLVKPPAPEKTGAAKIK